MLFFKGQELFKNFWGAGGDVSITSLRKWVVSLQRPSFFSCVLLSIVLILSILFYLVSSLLIFYIVGEMITYFVPTFSRELPANIDTISYVDLYFPDGFLSWDSLGFMIGFFTFLFCFFWGAFKIMINSPLTIATLKNCFYLFMANIFLFSFSVVVLADLEFLESICSVVLVFPLLDVYGCNNIFFRLLFYSSVLSVWFGPLLVTILIAYNPWFLKFRAYMMGTLLGVQLFLFYKEYPTLFQLYQQYKNYTFYQQGVLHNTLVDTTFVKVLVQPTRDQLLAIIKQMGLEYPQINRAADLFSYVPKQFFDLLSKSDLTEANLLFQELKEFHGPWFQVSSKPQYMVSILSDTTQVDHFPVFSFVILCVVYCVLYFSVTPK